MARTKNNQENEELKENVASEVTANVGEINAEPTQDTEIKENVEETTTEETIETVEKEAVSYDDAEKTNDEETIQASQEEFLKANMGFKDQYTKVVYLENTKFIVDENVEETTEIAENVYKISLKRAEEFKASGVVD